jgi:hypothetical protein
MFSRCLYVVVMSLIFWACSDLALNPSDLDGTFKGTFTITHTTGLGESGIVAFKFAGNQYTCIPEKVYLPPSGSGLFSIVHQTMRLTDTAIHTAEFDWTLILDGEFSISFDDSHLVLEQDDQKPRQKPDQMLCPRLSKATSEEQTMSSTCS